MTAQHVKPAGTPLQSSQGQQTPSQAQRDATVAAIAAVLAANLPDLRPHLSQLLTAAGYTQQVVDATLTVAVRYVTYPDPLGVAQINAYHAEAAYEAAFIYAATQRVQTAVDTGTPLQAAVDVEERYTNQYQAAAQARYDGAQAVDSIARAAGVHGAPATVLAWQTHLDDRTTPECVAANGKVFSVARPPAIGYPGTLHGGTCRCTARPATQLDYRRGYLA